MREIIGLFKFCAIWCLLFFFCTKDMKCSKHNEQEREKQSRIVERVGAVDSLTIADLNASAPTKPTAAIGISRQTKTEKDKTKRQNKSVSGFTLFLIVFVMFVLLFLILKRQKGDSETQLLRRPKDKEKPLKTSIRGIPVKRVVDVVDGYEKPAWEVGKVGDAPRKIKDNRVKHLTDFDEHFILKQIKRDLNWDIVEEIKKEWAYDETNKEIVKTINTKGYGETNVKAITACFKKAYIAEHIDNNDRG